MTVSRLSFKKRLALSLFRKFRNNEARLHQLNYILWECTLRCNLNCIHCGSDCKKDSAVKDMPAADFLKAIDQLQGIVNPNDTMIVLTGGEALVRKDLEQIGVGLYHRGFPWGLVSNGMLLSSQRLDSLLKSGLRAVTISLDGLEESHNWLRGSNKSFLNALNAIKLVARIPELKSDVVSCISQKNFHELELIKDLLIEAGVKEWRIFTVFPVGRAMQHSELQLKPEEFKALFEFINRHVLRKK